MNYLAHGYLHVDRPYFLAGTALPDWLRVVGRRLPLVLVERLGEIERSRDARGELAAGVCRHVRDDREFHERPAFREVASEITREIRRRNPGDRRLRASFLAHVLAELLLDATLARRRPRLLESYYEALERIDPRRVEMTVEGWLSEPVPGLSEFIESFRRRGFLADYQEDDPLLHRLAQVARRARLPELPAEIESVLPRARRLVAARAESLLGE